ncbi:MAG: hypothetical protein K8R54_15565 [Bacteroidales bacterium]|nr:hypothetical protein [Bacteroidales bacterium]
MIESIDLYYDENYKSEIDSIRTESKIFDDIKIDISYYQSGWGTSGFYHFDSLSETEYTVTFYGVEREFGKLLPDTVTFQKGDIWIRDTDSIVDYFDFSRLISRKKEDSNNVQYGRLNYEFYPKDTIYVNELSDYGFFKRIIETRFTTNK